MTRYVILGNSASGLARLPLIPSLSKPVLSPVEGDFVLRAPP